MKLTLEYCKRRLKNLSRIKYSISKLAKMKFSILIANYNNGVFFKDCYDSIVAQTYKDWEAIIVDDQSTDNSIEIISSLINHDPRFMLYTNGENRGCGFTKRRCAELASGEIAGFVDPDDSLVPDALEQMVKAHAENPAVSLVHSRFYFCDENLDQTALYTVAQSVQVTETFTNLEARVNHFASFKISFYKRTEGINSSLLRAVDQDLYLKLSETGPFYFVDKGLYNYRIHSNGISTFANVDKAFYWFLKVIMKAEERRGINLENNIAAYLNRTNPRNVETNLANPRYLLLHMLKSFKANPKWFFKKLFFKRHI